MRDWVFLLQLESEKNLMQRMSFQARLLSNTGYLGSVGTSRFFLFFPESRSQEMSVTSFCNCVECYFFHPNGVFFFFFSLRC